MAFRLYRPGGRHEYDYSYLMTDGEGCTKGQALVLTSGRLTSCGATTTPQYIAMATIALAATSVTPVPVMEVTENQEWATQSNATVAATLLGAKVTMATGVLLVTATTGSGVFEINATDGATTTSNVRGKFRR